MGFFDFFRRSKTAPSAPEAPTAPAVDDVVGPALTDPLGAAEVGKPYEGPGYNDRVGKGLTLGSKLGSVAGVSGATATGAYFGSAALGATTGAASSIASSSGAEAGGLLGLIDGGLTWRNANKRITEGKKNKDDGMVALGKEIRTQARGGVARGVLDSTATGLKIGAVAQGGKDAVMTATNGASYAANGLSIAGAATGIAGGAIGLGMAAYEGGKAVGRYRKANKADIQTARGKKWQAHIKGKQVRKGGIQALKAVAAGLGIAAGILVLASNPVGWAIGISGAILGLGVLAAKGITATRKKLRRRKKMAAKNPKAVNNKPKGQKLTKLPWYKRLFSRGGKDTQAAEDDAKSVMEGAGVDEEDAAEAAGAGNEDAVAEGDEAVEDPEESAQRGPAPPLQRSKGRRNLSAKEEPDPEKSKRAKAKAMADQVAKEAGKSAEIAGEMIAALQYSPKLALSEQDREAAGPFAGLAESINTGNPGVPTAFSPAEQEYLKQRKMANPVTGKTMEEEAVNMVSESEKLAQDAELLINALGLTKVEALSATGQEVLEKRMSSFDGA